MTTILRRSDPSGVDRVLRSLPDYFGIEEAIVDYVEKAKTLDSYIAIDEKDLTIGVALIDRHFEASAELALIAAHADQRSSGVGRALVQMAEQNLREDGCQYLEVHTVGPSFDHAGYASTRGFYTAVGFSPMHEFEGLDWDGPTLIMIKSLFSDHKSNATGSVE